MSHRRGEGQRPFSPSELEHRAGFPDPVSKNDFGSAFWSRFKTSAPPIECQEPAALRPDGRRHCRTKSHSVVAHRVCAAACYGSKRSKTHTDQERLGGPWRPPDQRATSLPSPSRPPHVSWPPTVSQFQLGRSDWLSHESRRVSSRVASAKSSSFGQGCEAGSHQHPGPGLCSRGCHASSFIPATATPRAGKARATVPRCLRRPRLISPQGSRPPPTLSVFPICEAIRRKSLSFVIYPWREEKRECGRWRGERKGRKRAKSSVAPELGSSQEPLAKPWVLGLTWFVWKGFSRGQSGITLQIASSHGTGLYQQGLWWVGFRLGGYRGGLYEFWVCLNGKGQLPAC